MESPDASERRAGLVLGALAVVAAASAGLAIWHRDLPWWDEANYLGLGRNLLRGTGGAWTVAHSPGYGVALGLFARVFGPPVGLGVGEWAGVLAFAAAVGALARLLWSSPLAWRAGALVALTTAHAYEENGVQRLAATLLMAAIYALARLRGAAGVCVAGALLVGAYTARADAVLAAVFVPFAAWEVEPGSRPAGRWARAAIVGAYGLGSLALLGWASRAGAARSWFAFQQHYAVVTAPGRAGLPAGYDPWLDYARIVREDFPGATSSLSALRIAPSRVASFVAHNAWKGLGTAVEALTASPYPRALAAVVACVLVATRVKGARGERAKWPAGVGWVAACLAASSVTYVQVHAGARHVLGLSLALGLLGAAAAQRWARVEKSGLLAVLTVATAASVAPALAALRAPRETSVRVAVAYVRARSVGRVIRVAGAGATSLCAYVDTCWPDEDPAAGGTGGRYGICDAVRERPDFVLAARGQERAECASEYAPVEALGNLAGRGMLWERAGAR